MNDHDLLRWLVARFEEYIQAMERLRLADYLRYQANLRKMMINSFLAGLMRGFGSAVGFLLLGAAVVVILQHIVVANVPFIGKFLAEVMEAAQRQLELRR